MAEPNKDRIDQPVIAAALAGDRRLTLADGRTESLASAVLLDLDGKGVQTLRRTGTGVRFDVDEDGLADATSWFGATDGLLFLDRNGDGTVTNAREFDFQRDVAGAASGLAGLKAFDTNKDGLLSAADTRWGDFRLWQDRNGNGVAEASEILTLSTAGVRSLALTAATVADAAASDATVTLAKGSYTRTSGATMELIDAALTYLSARRDGLPRVEVASQVQERRAGKYRITTRDGRLVLTPRRQDGVVDPRAGGLAGSVEFVFRGSTTGMLSAIVLDLDGDGVTLSTVGRTRGWFDMNGDGSPDEQGWVGRRDGFLVIDRNGDGAISGPGELTFLAEDASAGSSLAALAGLDANGDKILDITDARFGELRVWIDGNRNGIADVGELKTLADLDIRSISLDGRSTDRGVGVGNNLVTATSTFTYANGTRRTLGDVALAYRPSASPAAASTDAMPVVASAPTNGAANADTLGIVEQGEPRATPDRGVDEASLSAASRSDRFSRAASLLVEAVSSFAVSGGTGDLLSDPGMPRPFPSSSLLMPATRL